MRKDFELVEAKEVREGVERVKVMKRDEVNKLEALGEN